MFKRVMIALFVMSVGVIFWSEADAHQCQNIGGTAVCWAGGSGGEIALVETGGRQQNQACNIISGDGDSNDFITTLQVEPTVLEIRARAFGTVGQNCGFDRNEECDFRGLVCCESPQQIATTTNNNDGDDDDGDQDHRCTNRIFPGPVFARIEGGQGQCDGSEFCFTALRLQPSVTEQAQLCGTDPFVTATAGRFFGEVCVVDTNGETCLRHFCTGDVSDQGLVVYRCKLLPGSG